MFGSPSGPGFRKPEEPGALLWARQLNCCLIVIVHERKQRRRWRISHRPFWSVYRDANKGCGVQTLGVSGAGTASRTLL